MLSQKVKLFIVIGALSLIVIRLTMMYNSQSKEVVRLGNNMIAQNKSIHYYQSRLGETVAQQPVLQLKKQETAELFPRIIDELKNLKIKLNKTLNYSETAIQTEKNIITSIKDSTVNDTVHVKYFYYQDAYYTINGIVQNDTQKVNIQSRDSVIQVVYKGKRQIPYLWFFSKRKLEQVIQAKNPASTITYSKYIQIVKP